MKFLPLLALVFTLALFMTLPVAASPALDSPISPVENITTDFEALPDFFGLGAVVALVVVVMRMLKLPDGWGGYAALAVGVLAYAASEILPEASRDSLFEALDHASKLLIVVLGSQATHVSMKYSGIDRLWKWRDNNGD